MRNWRVLTVIAAVVLGLLAGVLVYQYVNNADDRAKEDTEQVEVLVASRVVPRGMEGARAIDGDFIGTKEIAREDLPPDYLTPSDEKSIRDLVAAGAIAEGLPIVQSSFVQQGTTDGLAGVVPKGRQAISIQVDDTHGVAGLIAPNDKINVLLSFNALTTGPQNKQAAKTTAFLLAGIKVLAVDNTTVTGSANNDGDDNNNNSDGSGKRGIVTLSVTPRQAEQIAHAVNNGAIYLSLNPPEFDAKGFQTPQEIVEAVNLFDQELTVLNQVVAAQAAG